MKPAWPPGFFRTSQPEVSSSSTNFWAMMSSSVSLICLRKPRISLSALRSGHFDDEQDSVFLGHPHLRTNQEL